MNPERAASHSAHTHVETKHGSVVSIPLVPDRVTYILTFASFNPTLMPLKNRHINKQPLCNSILLDKEPPLTHPWVAGRILTPITSVCRKESPVLATTPIPSPTPSKTGPAPIGRADQADDMGP